ncbi:AAA family ATPase [Lysinibacillus sp. 54212]|uniref:AAA family ATPase n=1 Tax=Lysinibacillus sp. 54212 TaxID=3119829 RepID=UPI002FCC9BE0
MITAVRIEGFQSHVESTFNLGNGLNVITGPSDAGKTAIIRAIRWIAFNEPTGEAYVNQKVGEAIVTVLLASGHIITKRRRKGKTSYLLQQNADDEGSLFEKSEVPDEVKVLLGIEKQSFGDFETALNFSFQLDAPFLISETASAGAKVLGKLAGTESVDLAIKGISKDTYATRQNRTNAEKDIERLSGSMLAYSHIDDAKQAVDIAHMLLDQVEGRAMKVEELKSHRAMYEASTNLIASYNGKLAALSIVPQLGEDLNTIEKAQQQKDRLLDLLESYLKLTGQLTEIDRTLDKLKEIDQAADVVEVLSQNVEKLNLFHNLQREYHKNAEIVNTTAVLLDKTKHIDALNNDIELLADKLNTLNNLRAMQLEYTNVVKRLEIAQEREKRFEGLGEALALLQALDEVQSRKTAVSMLLTTYKEIESLISQREQQLFEAKIALHRAEAEEATAWEAAGGICPTCEQPHERGAC